MSEPGVRPGGLTALAVINFVWAALELMSGAGQLAAPALMPMAIAEAERAASRETDAPKREKLEMDLQHAKDAQRVMQQHREVLMLRGSVFVLLGILLIISGIGYLKLRRFLGRNVGLAYATLAVAWGIAEILYVQKQTDESPGIFSLIAFIVPAVTFFALLVTFRDDFVNP
jgi:hypothetical protein